MGFFSRTRPARRVRRPRPAEEAHELLQLAGLLAQRGVLLGLWSICRIARLTCSMPLACSRLAAAISAKMSLTFLMAATRSP